MTQDWLRLWLPVVAWMGIIWLLSDQPDLTSGLKQDFVLRKLVHMGEFAVLTWLLFRVLYPTLGGTVRMRELKMEPLAKAAFIALGYALIDEWHQTWVAGRSGNLADVAVDATGIVIACVVLFRRRG